MSTALDIPRLKALAISLWREGGMNTLVKVAPKGTVPNAGFTAGYCTLFKYVVGRTPAEMEAIVGLAAGSKLLNGAEIFTCDPLPRPDQFELRGYTQCPGGISTDSPGYVPHPGYPPGLGAPQWELNNYPQSGLRWLATVPHGTVFSYPAANLPKP